jgi:hypothetical protein
MPSDEWTAGEGQEWVCGACGRHGKQRDRIGDEACFINAVLCVPAPINEDGVEWMALRASEPAGERK